MNLAIYHTNREQRVYRVYVPDNMGSGPYPLIIVHHGGGGNAERFAENKWDINGAGSASDFIIAFPQATELPNQPGKYTWNAGFSAQGISNADDVNYINDVLSEICSNYAIDRSNIFAAGNSNGGMFTYRLASERSYWFRGIGVAQGTAGGQQGLTSTPHFNLPSDSTNHLSVIAYHNREDQEVKFLPTLFRNYPPILDSPEDYDWYLNGRREIGFWPSVLSWMNHNHLSDAQYQVLDEVRGTYEIREWRRQINKIRAIINTDPTVGHVWPASGAEYMLEFFREVMTL